MLDTIFSLPMRLKQRVALSVLAALLLFAATAVWLQFTRDDLNWQRATLSLYLHGPQGMLLRVAYCVLASAIVVLGLALYMDMHGPARRSLPLMLFGAAGLGLATVAVGDSWLPQYAPLLAPLVHALAAQTAFLCITVAMLVQAWCFGRDVRWRCRRQLAGGWAWLAFAGLWLHVLWRGSPRGLGQKLVIAVVVGWLAWAAVRLWRDGRSNG